MSTDLYGIRILKKNASEKKIQIKVFVVYYDVSDESHQPIPKDFSFFFRILSDSIFAPSLIHSPLATEISNDLLYDEQWIDKNTFKYIEKVEQLSTANFPVTDYSDYDDFYYERNGAWVNEDQLVQAIYDVYVFDKKYISHLKEGMSWGTTAYETNAAKIAKEHRTYLPDLSRLIVKLLPFQDKKQEQGTMADARFSNDNTKLFALSDAGEVVAYHTENWEELWRYDTGEWFKTIECDDTNQLIGVNKTVLNFEGKKVEINIYPSFQEETENAKVYRSPSGNYFVGLYEDTRIVVFDKQGHQLWNYAGEEEGCLMYISFFNQTEQLLVREEEMGIFKIFELKTGTAINEFELDEYLSSKIHLHPTDAYLSFGEFYTKSSKIIDLKYLKTVFNFNTKRYNDDFLRGCIWSPNNEYGAMITIGEGQRRNNGYGGYLSIYAVGDD